MCFVCASLRPWTPGCDYDPAPEGSTWRASAGREETVWRASSSMDTLSASEIGDKLLTDYWNTDTPRSFDARSGDTLTYDVGALTSEGRELARSALDEWSAITGLKFRELSGGFEPEDIRVEQGDAAASTRTTAGLSIDQSFEGRIGSGDGDWIRIALPSEGRVTIRLEGMGSDALSSPGLSLYDKLGRAIPIGSHHFDDHSEVTFAITNGGGTYYAQVVGHGGRTGDYRLTLSEPGGRNAADISFDDERPGAYAETSLSGDEIVSAQINISKTWLESNGDEVGSYGFHTYLHEIGHALGLGHPGDYRENARFEVHAEYDNDSWQTSVMSYFSQSENPNVDGDKAYALTPMIGDVEAVRSLYGEAEVRDGNTTYGHRSTAGGSLDRIAGEDDALAFTIVDTGGRDEVDLSRTRADQRLDLRPEAVSDVLGHSGNMVIARGTVLEDAKLGSGDDTVRGNDAGNVIKGGSGDDVLRGDRGNDILKGGSGDDVLRGDEGRDRLKGGKGADRLDGGDGADKLAGGGGRDVLDGGEGKDKLKGGGGADVFVFGKAFGRDKVMDFDGSRGDRIDLSDVRAIRSWSDLEDDHLRDRGTTVVIRADDDGAIKLKGVEIGDLDADHFLF